MIINHTDESKIINEWITYRYPIENIIVVWLESANDSGKQFCKDNNIQEKLSEQFCIIEGDIEELEILMRKYHAQEPYMRLYVNGEYEDENT